MKRAGLSRWWIPVLVLLAVQGAAILAYVHVEGARGSSTRVVEAEPVSIDRGLKLERADGSAVDASNRHVVMLHLWATWCAPCRSELPGLLRVAGDLQRAGHVVLAVSVDENWDTIRHYFGGEVPEVVVRDRGGDVQRRLSAAVLPTTFLVRGQSQDAVRLVGSRSWEAPEMRSFVKGWLEENR